MKEKMAGLKIWKSRIEIEKQTRMKAKNKSFEFCFHTMVKKKIFGELNISQQENVLP